jgi:hypothetical protein
VAGSHFEVGYAIGQAFAARIGAMFANYQFLQEHLLPYYNTSPGRARYEALLEVNRNAFPGYMAELEGLAAGAGRLFPEVFLCNTRGEFRAFLTAEDHGCFDYAVLTDQVALLGHNEDGTPAAKETAYLVHAQVEGRAGWTAYSYPGFLCGNAFGFNQHGIAFAIDDVRPSGVRVGLARHFLARGLLDAHTLTHAVQRVTVPGRASGFHYSIASLPERAIVGVEVSPDAYGVHEVRGAYRHTNHYTHLEDVDQDIHPSSLCRLERAEVRPVAVDREQVLAVLDDEQDPLYPIYRTASPPDQACTLCTALFDLDRRVLSIYLDHPRRWPEKRVDLTLPTG